MLSHIEVSNMLLQQYPIPKDLFEHTDDYTFPSLKVDSNGIFTGECEHFQSYDIFSLTGEVIPKTGEIRDYNVENFILNKNIKYIVVDLDKCPTKHPLFESTRCSIYPEEIKDIPEVYDTVVICDYILKYIYRILMQSMVLNRTMEEIVTSNYLIGFKTIDDKYPISNIHRRAGFTKLLNTIRLFNIRNKSQKESIQKSYHSCKNNTENIKINLNYPVIKFSVDEEYLRLYPLVPNLSISYGDKEIPYYLTFVKTFIETHYEDIKKAFPIYNRLENIYRLCTISNMEKKFENMSVSYPSYQLVYTRTFPDKIMCCGGITLGPKEIVQVPTEKKKEKILGIFEVPEMSCRDAFDNGGLICSFAPKLQIRECLDKNLKAYHDCLAAEAKK